MIKRISHIGIAVEDLEEVRAFFKEKFGIDSSGYENFRDLIFSFAGTEGASLEFLQTVDPDGVIAKFIKKKGQGIHHIAMEVDDIQRELDDLRQKGVQLINEKPYLNAHKELVAFIHPRSTFGVLIELVQSKG
ncbi:MAG: methylmalonyl-CoA epimerase [Deltaproteobacteria bacterium]|nr:methylmalonyl-CoA epimerase [Deltaproteobacteria bacterium]MBW2138157.1 methylmalonyl-CoA epimerase [Deltaproteobacteria bacterium]